MALISQVLCHPHFTLKNTKAQSSQITCPKSTFWWGARLGLEPVLSEFRSWALGSYVINKCQPHSANPSSVHVYQKDWLFHYSWALFSQHSSQDIWRIGPHKKMPGVTWWVICKGNLECLKVLIFESLLLNSAPLFAKNLFCMGVEVKIAWNVF